MARTVDVRLGNLARKSEPPDHLVRVGIEVFRIGFEVDGSVGAQQPGVAFEEERRREAFLGPAGFELRVGEGDPQLRDLAFGEETVDELDPCAEESDVLHAAFRCGLGAAPHPGPLDVDADVVAVGVALGQRHGVFALSAPEFEHDGVVVVEEIGIPMPFERMVVAENLLEFGLYETPESEVFAEAA